MLICSPKSLTDTVKVENKLGLICGTSTCHMIVSEQPAYIPGVWGPYYSAMVPGMYYVLDNTCTHMLCSSIMCNNFAATPAGIFPERKYPLLMYHKLVLY